MIIAIASGKGGTGKTTVATNFALSLKGGVQFLDCDVEEPNAHIFIKPHITDKKEVFIPVPEIDESFCNACGRCKEVCAYNAIAVLGQKALVFQELCHGCGSCSYFCPQEAIHEVHKVIGHVERGNNRGLDFVHGILKIGEPMAPPLIKAVKRYVNSSKVTVIDAPPGTSCPVIAAIKDSDFVILVTEPTPFGLHDFKLAVEVVKKLTIPFGAIINRSDLGNQATEAYCKKEEIPILMRIPFQKQIASAYSRGELLIDLFPGYRQRFHRLFEDIKNSI
ncbi:MAG: ATP-binding protein [Candidatus Omnitrophica bacterium]|nr:ATP-binding protein [Candidatus Omnitrophota bacterium]